MRPRVVSAPFALAVGTAVLLAGCSSGGGSTATPSGSASPSGTVSGSGSPTASPTAVAAVLPASCQEMLPLLDLDEALGVPLVGRSVYIKGVAEPKIKRTGRVTCRYGITKLPGNKTSPPKLEVGVSAYADETSAQERVKSTVTDLRTQGGLPSQVQIGGQPATVLIGSRGAAALVVAAGNRTMVISLQPSVVPVANTAKALTAVGELALKNLPS